MLTSILIAVALGSVVSLAGGFGLLGLSPKTIRRAEHLFVAVAAGALLGAALIDLLPEAIELGPDVAPLGLLIGLGSFFLLERALNWFHHHRHEPGEGIDRTATLVIISDTLHNFVDGAAIAIAFIASPELGILTAVAVGLHEIPQEVGDFALLLSRGFSRGKVLMINIFSALVAFAGAGTAYLLADTVAGLLPWLLAGTAGMFLYISLSNLIPDLHRKHERGLVWLETMVLIGAVLLVGVVTEVAHVLGPEAH